MRETRPDPYVFDPYVLDMSACGISWDASNMLNGAVL